MGLFDVFKKTARKAKSNSDENQTIKVNVSNYALTQRTSSQKEIDPSVVPLENHVLNAIPSRNGLFPHEILLLNYAHTFYTEGNTFQGFWWYKYGIRDVQSILVSLMERGFLKTGDLRSTLERQTASILKELLKANNLKISGKKDELVQRLLDNIPESELCKNFPQRPYIRTDLGEKEIQDEAYVLYIHRHTIEDLDIWSLNKMINKKPYYPFRDKIWGYLNERSMKHFEDGNFGLYRNTRFHMSRLLCEEEKYKTALEMLAEVVFIDLSGAGNNYNQMFLEIKAQYYFPYEKSLAKTAPAIIETIFECQKELGCSDEEVRLMLQERMEKTYVPFHLFEIDECVQIVFLERDQDIAALTQLYERAKREFKNKYPKIKI